LNDIDNHQNHDVEINVTDLRGNEKTYYGHKAIIAFFSKFFETKFNFDNQKIYQHTSYLTLQSFDVIFDFWYGKGFVVNDIVDALYLLGWVDFYQINDIYAADIVKKYSTFSTKWKS